MLDFKFESNEIVVVIFLGRTPKLKLSFTQRELIIGGNRIVSEIGIKKPVNSYLN